MNLKFQGFSLIELLVAVFLTSIVSLAAFTLLGGSTSAYNDQNVRRKLAGNIRNAEMQLQNDLSRTGYRFPFYVNGTHGQSSNAGGGLNNIQAFIFHPDPSGKNAYSAFTLFTSEIGYNGFEVDDLTGNRVLLNPHLIMPMTAAEVDTVTDSCDGVGSRSATSTEFWSAVSNAFTPNLVGFTLANDSGDKWKFFKKGNDCGNCYNFPSVPPTVFGTERYEVTVPSGAGTVDDVQRIYPIVAITYMVLPKEGEPTNMQLVRCYNTEITNPTTSTVTDCQVLLERMQYFDVIPLLLQGNDSTITPDQSLFHHPNVSGQLLSKKIDQFGSGKFGSEDFDTRVLLQGQKALAATMNNVRAFYFRFSAAGDTQNEQAKNGVLESDNSEDFHVFTYDGYPIIHSQGTAPIFAITTENNVIEETLAPNLFRSAE